MTIPLIGTGLKPSPSCGEPVCPGAPNGGRLPEAMEIPPTVFQHLLDYEILSGAGIFERKGCILINDAQSFDSERIWGKVCHSPFGTLHHMDQTGYFGLNHSGQEVLVDIDGTMADNILQSSTLLLFDYELTAGRGDFPSHVLHLRPTQGSFLIPWGKPQTDIPWMVDLFAGGYGGWSFSLRFLTEDLGLFSTTSAFSQHRVIAVEQDTPAAASHAHNHGMHLLPNEVLPSDWFQKFPQSAVINAPIQSAGWKQSVASLTTDLWTISHPCQCWTNAAHSKGFDDQNGLVFATALGLIRIYRPKFVALENVKNFRDHCQYPLVQALIKWAGYNVLHQGIYDAGQQLPAKRPRYLAVLQRVEESNLEFQWHSWQTISNITPNVWDAWTPTTSNEFQQFTLAPEAKCMYLDPKLLPIQASQYTQDMMKFRIPPSNQKLPVFMAAYGSHHHLPFSLLKEKGMHGFFTREQGTYRWFKPEEILMLHSHPYTCTLLKPAELSWKFLGNSIVMHHGIMVLANILGHQYGVKTSDEFHNIFQTLDSRRLRANTSMITSDEYAWYIGQREQVTCMQSKIRFLAHELQWLGSPEPTWPDGVFFHHEHGLQRIQTDTIMIPIEATPITVADTTDNETSQTVGGDKHCDVTIAASPGTYGILHFDDLWDWNDIQNLWDDRFIPYSVDGSPLESHAIPAKAILMPTPDDHTVLQESQKCCILWDEEFATHCHIVASGTKWKDIQTDFPHFADYSHDDYGRIPPEMTIRSSLKVSVDPLLIQPFPDLNEIVASFEAVNTIALTPSNTDILVVVFIGPEEDLIKVLTFWQYALNTSWTEHHARQMCFQVETSTKARLIFRPAGNKFATPVSLLKKSIQAQLLKTVFASFHDRRNSSIVKVQFENRYIHEVSLPLEQTFSDFYQLCQHVTLFSNNGLTPALLVGLKRVGDEVTIGKLVDHYGQSFRCIVGQTLFGGGSKNTHKQSIQASLASALIEQGVKLDEVSSHVQTIIKQIGLPKLTQVLFVSNESDRNDQIGIIIDECKIPRKANVSKVATTKAKYTKIALDHQMKHSGQIDVTQYKVMPGFFLRQNGEPLPIHASFSPCVSGVR